MDYQRFMCDFFTVAVRTGGPGHQGISMVLIERDMPGVKCRQMDCTGVWASGTTYITFEDVKVPVENLIGQEGHGFRYIMYNFNHERWMLIGQAVVRPGVPRGVREARHEAQDVWQETDRAPRYQVQDRRDGQAG